MERALRDETFPVGNYLTGIAAKMVWLRSSISQAEKLLKICRSLLDDLHSYQKLDEALTAFIERSKGVEQEHFDSW